MNRATFDDDVDFIWAVLFFVALFLGLALLLPIRAAMWVLRRVF